MSATTILNQRQSIEGLPTDSLIKKTQRSVKKVILAVFWDMKSLMTFDLLGKVVGVNNAY